MGCRYTQEEHGIIREAYRQKVPLMEIIERLSNRTPGGLVQEISRQARFDNQWGSENLGFYLSQWRALRDDPKWGYKKRDPNASRKKGGKSFNERDTLRSNAGLSFHKKNTDDVNLVTAFQWSDRVRDLGYDLHEIRLLNGSKIRVVPKVYQNEEFDGSAFRTDLTAHLSLAASELEVELDGRVSVQNGGKNYELAFNLDGLEREPRMQFRIFLNAYVIALERDVIDEFKD